MTKRNRNFTEKRDITKFLSITLIVILAILIYTPLINSLAIITSNPNVCYGHAEIKKDSFIFYERAKDNCLTPILLEENNPEKCETDSCVNRIAANYRDLSVCNYAEDYSTCIFSVSIRLTGEEYNTQAEIDSLEPEICNVLTKKEAKESCFKRFAFTLDDKEFCSYSDDFLNCYLAFIEIEHNDDESQCDLPLTYKAKEECISYVHMKPIKAVTVSDVTTQTQ